MMDRTVDVGKNSPLWNMWQYYSTEFFLFPAAAPEDRGWGSSTLCEPHQPAETGGKLTMLIRFMGNLPHVLPILETFKRADHRGDREDEWGSIIGERKWTEWVKTEEDWAWRGSQLNFSSYLSVWQEQAAASPPVSQTEERGRACVHRWWSGFHSASPHPLHQTDVWWEVKHFAQTAQMRIKGIPLRRRSSAAEVFHDQLRKLQLALNCSVSEGFDSWPLDLTHFQWSTSLCKDANKTLPVLQSEVHYFNIFICLLGSISTTVLY